MPDRSVACRGVAEAAAALGLLEYDFVRLAYRRWFGRQPADADLERAFARYMFHGSVPGWVTHLVRQVHEAQAAGPLPADAFGASRYRDRPARPRHGRLWVAGFAAAWFAFFLAILGARYDPGTAAPVPFCWDPASPHPVAVWIRMATDRPLPACDAVTESSHAPDR